MSNSLIWKSLAVALFLLITARARAATFEARPGDDLQALVNKLAPGDVLLLRGGHYFIKSLRIEKQGLPGKYIVIAAAANEQPILTSISTQHNLISVRSAAYVIIDGLTLDGTPPNVDAIKFEHGHASHNVVIQNCEIRNYRGVAINSKGEDHHITVRRCRIHHSSVGVGEAFYIGKQDGSTTPHHWLIENNLIHDTAGKQGDGIELKYGVHSSVVRDNVIYNTQYPAILTYGVKGENAARALSNLIEGNLIFDTNEGLGIYADAVVRNNIVINCKFGYQTRPHRKPPQNLEVYNNTFYACEVLYLQDWRQERHCVFVNNAAFNIKRGVNLRGTGIFASNVGDFSGPGFRDGTAENDLSSPQVYDFYPTANSALRDRADARWTAPYDFNQQPRHGRADIGAYEWNGEGNPRGALTRDFKIVRQENAAGKP